MKSARSILYCHCAYAEIVPPEVKAAVLAGLAESGAEFEAVADLCELAARRDPAMKRWAESAALHVVACYPRAVKWLFARAGEPLRDDAVIHNMRAENADDILARISPHGRAADGSETGEGLSRPLPTFPAKQPGEWIPWFPVIDYDRCENCKQCLEFCLFGAYAVADDGTVRVAQPERCKLNCPACARVCPASAIIFPKFAEGGPIGGDEGVLAEAPEEGIKADLARLSKGDVMDVLRRRAARARAAAGAKYRKEKPNP